MKHFSKVAGVFVLMNLSSLVYSQNTHSIFEKELQTKLILAKAGDIIDIEEGFFEISRSLSLDQGKNITIKGKGMDKTILSFANQNEGAEGIRITGGWNITIEDLTIQNAEGDAIKTQNVDGIIFNRVKAEWTGKPKKTNGAYGLYPVSCKNVLIDSCIAIGASDAGIYVGQSQNIIVRNSEARHNVAGIEIENSLYADVYNNTAHHNTGGILVFDLPDLVQKKGGFVRVFNNKVTENNYPNFAPKGNIVGKVPNGTGIIILATSDVEVFENEIINNKTAGTTIISYYMTEEPIKDSLYYPYPTNIFIHDNVYERRPVRATMKGRMGKMFRFKLKFGKDVPHIYL
ncbi:parallel beta-helix domain-containing protein [Fulvivirgaceae bacterium BMA10]|uniref:Parallel beta-helix domain-containing protein n=1 Tax=Splendidivirga corallicola TaxID=3051826 RepID=A0ABT8KM63_9BACT|nr:parallel beta-helix domain-containing protein [Fulvivirgaceae bacterium BMA10]